MVEHDVELLADRQDHAHVHVGAFVAAVLEDLEADAELEPKEILTGGLCREGRRTQRGAGDEERGKERLKHESFIDKEVMKEGTVGHTTTVCVALIDYCSELSPGARAA